MLIRSTKTDRRVKEYNKLRMYLSKISNWLDKNKHYIAKAEKNRYTMMNISSTDLEILKKVQHYKVKEANIRKLLHT